MGRIPWNKGKTKIDFPQLKGNSTGHKQTEDAKKKIGRAARNRIVSKETREKSSNSHRGEKCHWWKGGKTAVAKLIRVSFKYRQWRSDVFTRDNYTCLFCNVRGGKLEADHIKRLSDIITEYDIKTQEDIYNCEELWDINNGRTLCIDCHKKTDTYGRPKKLINSIK